MKKTIILAALAIATLGFTSCDSETEPKLQFPEEGSFVLNTPALADQYLNLTKDGTMSVVCSQPNYGVAVQSVYELQVSTTADFAEYETLTPVDPNSTTITVNSNDIAIALTTLYGYENRNDFEAKYDGSVVMYARAYCYLDGVKDTGILSNVIKFSKVGTYYAAAEPGWIYLVGNISEWKEPSSEFAAHYENYKVMETGIGTNIYRGSFKFTEAPAFRFYTDLTGWEANSIGYQVEDKPTQFEVIDNSFSGACVKGKGSWEFPDVTSGTISVEVDLNAMLVRFNFVAEGEEDWSLYDRLYIVGDAVETGWNVSFDIDELVAKNCVLYDRGMNGVFVSKEPIALAADKYFRFYSAPGDWDSNSIGNQVDDTAIDIDLPYEGTCVWGKGSWHPSTGGLVDMEVDINNLTVKFTPVE